MGTIVVNGSTLSDKTISSGTTAFVFNNGALHKATIENYGSALAYANGIVSSSLINGDVTVSAGGSAYFNTVVHGNINVSGGGDIFIAVTAQAQNWRTECRVMQIRRIIAPITIKG